jgi:deaminated glutathione amidase
MKFAAIQTVSGADVLVNLGHTKDLIAQAAASGAQVIALPEYFCVLGHNGYDKVHVAEADDDGPIQNFLSEQAQRHRVYLLGGTVPLRSPAASKVFNSSLLFNPLGQRVARYDKIHLFGLDYQGQQFDESQTIVPGNSPVQCSIELAQQRWTLGLTICYDLRFAELFRAVSPRQQRCDVIFVPSAFTFATGQDHWEVLLRARAIENQCYVVAPAQGGLHENGRRTWGHSMIIDPWGRILACQPQGAGIVVADLSLETIAQVRASLPSLAHQIL